MTAVEELLLSLGSSLKAVTVAVLVIVVPTFEFTLNVSCIPAAASVLNENGSRLPTWQVTTLDVTVQGGMTLLLVVQLAPLVPVMQTAELTRLIVLGSGIVSVTLTPVARFGPRLNTAMP